MKTITIVITLDGNRPTNADFIAVLRSVTEGVETSKLSPSWGGLGLNGPVADAAGAPAGGFTIRMGHTALDDAGNPGYVLAQCPHCREGRDPVGALCGVCQGRGVILSEAGETSPDR